MTQHAASKSGPTVDAALDLVRLTEDHYAAPNFDLLGTHPLYGGQLASQAMRAASYTVAPNRVAQSMHGYFLRPALPGPEITFRVQRERDGRRYAWRRVTAAQNGETIFTLACLFSESKTGPDFQAMPMPLVRSPNELEFCTLPTPHEEVSRLFDLDSRFFEDPEPWYGGPRRLWVRVGGALPDDDNIHACAVVFLSDMSNGLATAPQAGPGTRLLSLDHTVWLHRRCRADDWLLLDLEPHTTCEGRGLYTGRIFDQTGALVASLAQECLFDHPQIAES